VLDVNSSLPFVDPSFAQKPVSKDIHATHRTTKKGNSVTQENQRHPLDQIKLKVIHDSNSTLFIGPDAQSLVRENTDQWKFYERNQAAFCTRITIERLI